MRYMRLRVCFSLALQGKQPAKTFTTKARRHQEKLDQLRAFVSLWLNRISASNNLLLPPGLAVARQNFPFLMQEIIGRLLAGDAAREPVKWVQKAICRIARSFGRSAMFIENFCSMILKLQRSDMLANCF